MSKAHGLPQAALLEVDGAIMVLTSANRKLQLALDALNDPGVKLLVALALADNRQAAIHLQAAQIKGKPQKDGTR